ncbi:nucleotide sugar dehydrogenase [Ectothiorhodospira mobilis]|uniref:nucleotide sugar dehydrogenase n=1 Tax=Ectothiorhodospira mobilis TaxID=195064 RepID=UPI001908193C|nr:nucleotide sugar dehydrogenase [Ectothiorhodospira mobilis]MBK1690638.1 UDP-N-acetyl-D-galactosamine dehydrogenase [Ectothiorhodospira mobilis]
MNEKIGVIGLGYVGLPVALAFAQRIAGTVGFDISPRRIRTLRDGHDYTGEVTARELQEADLHLTDDPGDLAGCTFLVVTVPTPIDANRQPDLDPLIRACETVGRVLAPGAVVVFESTVYPGVTETICGPVLARVSGLRQGVDFKLGYSPERINPGDREHTLERIVKVVAGEDEHTLERVAAAYGAIVDAGVHRAPSIQVAEAAKVIENTQRDLNIALMNELALIFDRLGIRTRDVLEAAGTKWNFLPFRPGLVGGHCIGVDPYYLTAKAKAVGYYPQVILAGRRINDGMGAYVAQRLVKLLIEQDRPVKRGRVGVLGITFKEDVPDLRNSRVPDILQELRQFGIEPCVHDPLADPEEAREEYGLELVDLEAFTDLDGLILAVPHRAYLEQGPAGLCRHLVDGGVLVDVKSVLAPQEIPGNLRHWSL